MPIKPENRHLYPKDWKQIRQRILDRAGNRCEFCGVENHTYRLNPKTGKQAYIVLTVAHLDHCPEHCDPENLRALCQRCHNRYDAAHRAQTRHAAYRTPTSVTPEIITHAQDQLYGQYRNNTNDTEP